MILQSLIQYNFVLRMKLLIVLLLFIAVVTANRFNYNPYYNNQQNGKLMN